MSTATTRYGALAALLALIWIGVYWWTPSLSTDSPTIQRSAQRSSTPDTDPLIRTEPPPILPAPPPLDEEPLPNEQQGPQVIPPRFHDYVVRTGDNAAVISERFYGTRRHEKAIMRANPNVSFDRLRAGRTIRVPVDPGNIQGLPAENAETPPPPPIQPDVTYTVRAGDTLSDIASTVYGRAALWTLIRDANPTLIRRRDGTDIRPGMVLTIPPAPDTDP